MVPCKHTGDVEKDLKKKKKKKKKKITYKALVVA